jgi:hypothetical protein
MKQLHNVEVGPAAASMHVRLTQQLLEAALIHYCAVAGMQCNDQCGHCTASTATEYAVMRQLLWKAATV